ncbi:protection of telomeres protein 1b-like [Henckelia pumila]|uniref:protection of telomeres protein 1b-like n=1 Tax=Henckelia pumila TaxID=405737 RepID=UPI003C6E4072
MVEGWKWMTVAEAPLRMNKTVDMMGIVVETGVPYMSKGPDHCVIFKIIDDSVSDRELSVNFFSRSIDALPRLRGHLDIILLQRVQVLLFNDGPCVSFRKTSSFALFDGRDVADCNPYQLSPGLCGLQTADRFVRHLRLWSSATRFDAGVSTYALRLADINTMDYFDLVCKVLHVSEVSDGKWMLFVWDGTDAPPLNLSTELTNKLWQSLPLRIEPVSLPEHVLREFPHVGTVLRVVVDGKYESFGFHFQHADKWVRLRNLACETESGLWKAIFTPSSKIRLLSGQDNSVDDRLRASADRIRRQGRIPSAMINGLDILTVVGNEGADFSTLMDLLCSALPHGAFKCIVRVVDACPLRAKDFRTPAGLFRLRLTLEDPTARIHAYLSHEDAVFLFGGDLEDNMVSDKMYKLLGVDEYGKKPSKDPPWVQCCIGFKSSGPSKQFHICKTAFAD